MDVQELVAVVRRRLRTIVALVLIGVVAAAALTATEKRMYTARAQVLVRPAPGQTASDLNSGATLVERAVQTYAELARTPVVLEPVAFTTGVGTVESLSAATRTSISSGTLFITIAVTWSSPDTAADLANSIGDQLAVEVANISPKQGGRSSVGVTTVAPAVAPSSPSSPDTTTNLLIGGLAGLLVALGYTAFSATFDSRVRSAADLRRMISAPVLGTIPRLRTRRRAAINALDNDERLAEDYRRVRTNLRMLDPGRHPRALVVTSCTPSEGTATFVVGLARAAVEGGLSVCLIDADLHAQRLATMLGVPGRPGLAEVLSGTCDLKAAVHTLNGMDVVAAGGPVSTPGDLVSSIRMTDVLVVAKAAYDVVICAAAPLLSATTAAALGASGDGVVLVVGNQRVNRSQVGDAIDAIEMAGARLVGVVFSEAPTPDRSPIDALR